MARIDTLRLLVLAEPPDTLQGVETSMREISSRINEIDPEHGLYGVTHARLDLLLTLRERLITEAAAQV